jgi:hypothetical protein
MKLGFRISHVRAFRNKYITDRCMAVIVVVFKQAVFSHIRLEKEPLIFSLFYVLIKGMRWLYKAHILTAPIVS